MTFIELNTDIQQYFIENKGYLRIYNNARFYVIVEINSKANQRGIVIPRPRTTLRRQRLS